MWEGKNTLIHSVLRGSWAPEFEFELIVGPWSYFEDKDPLPTDVAWSFASQKRAGGNLWDLGSIGPGSLGLRLRGLRDSSSSVSRVYVWQLARNQHTLYCTSGPKKALKAPKPEL